MSSFTDGPVLRPSNKVAGLFVGESGFRLYWDESLTGLHIRLEPGYLTNGASVPFPFNLIFPRFHPDYNSSCPVHDAAVGEFGQEKAGLWYDDKFIRYLTWEEAAKWMKRGMEIECRGKKRWKRQLFFKMVMLNKRIRRLKYWLHSWAAAIQFLLSH